jgi:hypothetical protein
MGAVYIETADAAGKAQNFASLASLELLDQRFGADFVLRWIRMRRLRWESRGGLPGALFAAQATRGRALPYSAVRRRFGCGSIGSSAGRFG